MQIGAAMILTCLVILEDNERNEVSNIHKEPSQSQLSLDLEVEAIYGIDTPLAGSVLSLYPGTES